MSEKTTSSQEFPFYEAFYANTINVAEAFSKYEKQLGALLTKVALSETIEDADLDFENEANCDPNWKPTEPSKAELVNDMKKAAETPQQELN